MLPKIKDLSNFEDMNNYNTLGHKDNIKLKDAQKNSRDDLMVRKILKTLENTCDTNGSSVDSLNNTCTVINNWAILSKGGKVNMSITNLIHKIQKDDNCNCIYYFNNNNEENIWIVAEKEKIETVLKYTELVEDFIYDNDINIEYLILAKTQIDGINNQLSQMNVKWEVYQ